MSKQDALESALQNIRKAHGETAVMKMGERPHMAIETISTGSLSIDLALGVGGLPKGRVAEIYGPESSGKCLTADTLVWTDKGLETIAEIFERCGMRASCTSRVTDVTDFDVRVVNEHGELEQVSHLTHNNRRQAYKVTLASGRQVTATANHPLRVINEHGFIVWKKVGDLGVDDTVVSGRFGAGHVAGDDTEALSEDEALLLGYLVGDGTLGWHNRTRVRFSAADEDALADYYDLAEAVLGVRPKYSGNQYDHDINSVDARHRLADEYGLDYVNAPEKRVPRRVRLSSPKVQAAFLSTLFESDGYIEAKGSVGMTLSSESLIRDVQVMLLGFGISASVCPKSVPGYDRTYWRLQLTNGGTNRFLDLIGFRTPRRGEQVRRNQQPDARDPQVENIPNLSGLVASFVGAVEGDRDLSELTYDILAGHKVNVSRSRLVGIVEWGEADGRLLNPSASVLLDHFRTLAGSDYTYEAVVSVEDMGAVPTFDLMVPESHSFLANGVLSHNTTLALHVIAEAQRQGGVCAFIDAEHALDPVYAKAIGVDVDELLVAQPDTGEQALEITDTLAKSGALAVIVVDSVAALTPRAEIEGEMGDAHVGLQARLMSQALRKLTGTLNKTGTICIFINQLREKIGVMFGSPETTPGGRALKFYSSVRIDVRRIGSVKDGADVVGNDTRVKIVKNKVAPPFKQVEFQITYGEGISRGGDLIDVAVENGVVKKSGAWYTYDGEQLGQGKQNAIQTLKDNPEMFIEIDEKVRRLVGLLPPAADPETGEIATPGQSDAVDDGDVLDALPEPIDN